MRKNCDILRLLWCGFAMESITPPSGTQWDGRRSAAATAAVVLGTFSGALAMVVNIGSRIVPCRCERATRRGARRYVRARDLFFLFLRL